MGLFTFALFLSVLAPTVLGAVQDGHQYRPRPLAPKIGASDGDIVLDRKGSNLPPLKKVYTFDQLIDHDDPQKGTFKQRYWHTWKDYEKGGPIILMTPGEANAEGYEGYLTNATINGQIAQQQGGATIVIEHRFYGESNPYPDLTVKSLRYHTIAQAIADLEYFAENVKLAMPGGDHVNPDKAPWILIGGSYSGALTAWTMEKTKDVFYAGYSSSGVVHADVNFWRYFEPVREAMPKNCSADVQKVIAHVDDVLASGNASTIKTLKAIFGMEELEHDDDFAANLRKDLFLWQALQPDTGPGANFYKFCDALEVKDGKSASSDGWGLDHALEAWGAYYKKTYVSFCKGNIQDCLGTYDKNSTTYTDTSVDNFLRSWLWTVCNEIGFLRGGAPKGQATLVSRAVQPIYDERQCQYMFPEAFDNPPVPRANATNAELQGWDIKVNRLFVANGQRDPWRDATLSAEQHPVQSTDDQPIVMSDGFHCSDLHTGAASVDKTVADVQKQALSYMKKWLKAWDKATKTPDAVDYILPDTAASLPAAIYPSARVGEGVP